MLLSLTIDSQVTLPDSLIPRKNRPGRGLVAKRQAVKLEMTNNNSWELAKDIFWTQKENNLSLYSTNEIDTKTETSITVQKSCFSGHSLTEVLLIPKQVLSLSYRNLSTFPSELFQLPILTSLDLSSNNLDSLPADICKLVSLKFFNTSRNKLKELPEEFQHLTSLVDLRIGRNQLTSIPAWYGLN